MDTFLSCLPTENKIIPVEKCDYREIYDLVTMNYFNEPVKCSK